MSDTNDRVRREAKTIALAVRGLITVLDEADDDLEDYDYNNRQMRDELESVRVTLECL